MCGVSCALTTVALLAVHQGGAAPDLGPAAAHAARVEELLSEWSGPPTPPERCVASPAGPEELLRCTLAEFTAAEVVQLSDGPRRPG